MSKTNFQKIYEITRCIPEGKVATYGQIAALAGIPRAARIVGFAMASCSDQTVPCHRVVDRQGGTKAAFDVWSTGTQQALLEAEGVTFVREGKVDMAAHLWDGQSGKEPS